MNFIIHRKVLISMLFTGLTLLGYISYKHLSVELFPTAELPTLFVQVYSAQPTDPKKMEQEAVIPLEGTIGQLKDVQKIESISNARNGRIRISYQSGVNMKYAYLKLLEKINEKAKTLPLEYRVQVIKFDMQQINNMFMTIQVRGGSGVDRVRHVVDTEILERLQNVDGIANAEVYGGRQKSVQIELKKDILDAYKLSPNDIKSILTSNSHIKTYAGHVYENNQKYTVNVASEYNSVKEIEDLIVLQQGPVRLKDVSTINFGVKEQNSYSRINGKESVTISLIKTAEANLLELSDEVNNTIAQINDELKANDIEVVVQTNMAETMEKNINLIILLAIAGGLLSIFVLWIFLKNIKLVVTIGLAIPISVFSAFSFFYAFDITINSFTLMGVALAVGMLLDSSIVVLENIYRLASKKVDADKAVVSGTSEVWRSIVAATLTTVMIFLPFAFSENLFVKLLGKNIGVSVISMLLISLAVSLLLVPMITHSFINKKQKGQSIFFKDFSIHNRFVQIYLVFLKSAMRKPANTIIGALLIFFVSILTTSVLNIMNQTENEVKELTLYINMPKGSTLEATDKLVAEVEEKLLTLEERKELISQINEGEATIKINLVDDYRDLRNFSIAQIEKDILERVKNIPPAQYSYSPFYNENRFGGGGMSLGVDAGSFLGSRSNFEKILIKGNDFDKMLSLAENIKYHLTETEFMARVNISSPSRSPEVHLNFDKYFIGLNDIPPMAIVSELNTFPQEITSGAQLNHGLEKFDIILKNEERIDTEQHDRTLDDLKRTKVRSKTNALFEMQEISRFDFSEGLSAINRTNQAKYLEVHYSFFPEINKDPDLLLASQNSVDNIVNNMAIPSDIAVEVVHDDRELNEFIFLILASIIFIYMILASVFESFITPVVLLFSIPLAAIGSIIALAVTGNPIFNNVTLIGFIILLGIVVNNGIILIDYSRLLKKRGYSSHKALMTAGLSRVRPILITAITTIVGLFPVALGDAEYISQLGVPFAITVIGGLALSTILTLVFIPTLNSGLDSALRWIHSRRIITKLFMLSVFLLGFYIIYTEINSLVWQIINFIVLIILVPAAFYFVQNSLRKANEQIIDPNEPLTIVIRNLVKIYDRDSRFTREWKSGLNIRRRLGITKELSSWKDFDMMVWQIPLLAFTIYFTYFHIHKGFWYLVFHVILYILTLAIFSPLKDYLKKQKNRLVKFVAGFTYGLFYWTFPGYSLFAFYKDYRLIVLVILLAVLWYFFSSVYITSNYLFKNNININRIQGRFKGIRKGFFRLVSAIPLIGKKKRPFKALKGVSIKIEKGMFGLLGPNGAGKSTLIRIICGLLEPSYGKITINEIDIKEKREELQGLIGYLPQEFGMYENLTAWDFLQYMAIMKKITNKKERNQRVEYVLQSVHMLDHKDEKIGSFSGGMRQRIGIAQILLHLPRILVVDEPTAGLDPRERIRFRNLLVELSKERIVIFSTHIIEDIASSCNQVAVIKEGELKYLGAPIQMANIASGKVWVVEMKADEFDKFKENHTVIHHISHGDLIRTRCLAESAPHINAKEAKANLEDAYLYLLYQLKVQVEAEPVEIAESEPLEEVI